MSEPLTAQAVVVRAPGARALLEPIVVDPPGPGEVRVRVLASGVCHTDLHCQKGEFGRSFPYLLGHEATAMVESVGPGVQSPAVGDVVALAWRSPCGVCRFCAAGRLERCARPVTAEPRMRTSDGLPLGRVLGLGTFATHTVVAAAQAIPLPTGLGHEASCLIGCGVATGVGAVLHVARVPVGASVAVIGCGAVGLSVVQGARLARAGRVIAVDRVARKLDWARGFGATDLVDASEPEPVARVRELAGGRGVDFAFEAVGLPETLGQALQVCDLGGTCTLIGVPAHGAELALPMADFFYGRRTLVATSFGDCLPARDIPLIARLALRGELDLGGMVTERIGLGDVEPAFEAMRAGRVVRSVITM
ncbi:MAG: zinc-binding dehydrogenase [Myxococcales bacterium]|nr:zinc-binding dehydrogenase [Myxococcales bacterium]